MEIRTLSRILFPFITLASLLVLLLAFLFNSKPHYYSTTFSEKTHKYNIIRHGGCVPYLYMGMHLCTAVLEDTIVGNISALINPTLLLFIGTRVNLLEKRKKNENSIKTVKLIKLQRK